MDIKAVTAAPPLAVSRAIPPPGGSQQDRTPGANALGPAVTPALGKETAPAGEAAAPATDRAIYTRDAESRTLVFQVVDPASGDVVMQIPNAVVLRARAYQASNAAPQTGLAVQKQA